MANPRDTRGEQPSTYFVQDRSSREELTRVTIQDQTITVGMMEYYLNKRIQQPSSRYWM